MIHLIVLQASNWTPQSSLFPSSSKAQVTSICGFVRGVSSSLDKYFTSDEIPDVIDDRNFVNLPSEFLYQLKLLPLPDVDPNTLPKLVEGELKLWLPASEPRPADLSDVSLFFELNRLSHFRFGPMKRLDFCHCSAAFTNLSFCQVDIKSASSEIEGELIAGESYLIDLNEG